MSRADIEMLRAGYEAFSRGDWGGDQIVVLVVVRSRPRGSNAFVENRIGHLWTMQDGQVLRFQIFPERKKALEAAGLSGSA